MKAIATFSVLAVALFASVDASGFCYRRADPHCTEEWPGVCATGKHQSPIDIVSANSTEIYHMKFNDEYKKALINPVILNNGHTVQLSLNNQTTSNLTVTLVVNSITTEYTFAQLHGHWLSEHTVDLKVYDVEIHLVHYQTKYGSVAAAVASNESDALLVIGIFYQAAEGNKDNAVFEILTQNAAQVTKADDKTFKTCSGSLVLHDLLPNSGTNKVLGQTVYDVAHYYGSLTTPGCAEVVNWFVIKKPVPISLKQKEAFYVLQDSHNKTLKDNNREVQALNGRIVAHAVMVEKTVDRASIKAQVDGFFALIAKYLGF